MDLIRDNYKTISTTVRLSDNSPGNVAVKYKVVDGCESSTKDNECTGRAFEYISKPLSLPFFLCFELSKPSYIMEKYRRERAVSSDS